MESENQRNLSVRQPGKGLSISCLEKQIIKTLSKLEEIPFSMKKNS